MRRKLPSSSSGRIAFVSTESMRRSLRSGPLGGRDGYL
jgi:hypothetical protein